MPRDIQKQKAQQAEYAKRPEVIKRRAAQAMDRRRRNPARALWERARDRAKAKGLVFSIEIEDIVIPSHCPVFGYKLEFHKGWAKNNSPSLDRIDSSLGYVKNNVQVISHRANVLKRDATFEEIKKLYKLMEVTPVGCT